jgi:hypothetical protein
LAAKLLQVFVGGEPSALGGVVLAADAVEGAGGGAIGEVERAEGVGAGLHLGERLVGDLGFETHIAAAEPIGIDERLDEELLFGAGGLELVAVVAGEVDELVGVLAGDDQELRVGAVAQGVHAGGGLAFFGARTGGLHRVQAIGVDLSWGCHRPHVSRPAGGSRQSDLLSCWNRGRNKFRRLVTVKQPKFITRFQNISHFAISLIA